MEEIKEAVAELISNNIGMNKQEILNAIEIPPSPELGDYAFPCFVLAREMKKNPVSIATDIAMKINSSKEVKKINEISGVKATGPYINFFIDKKVLAEYVINRILKAREKYGKNNKKAKEERGGQKVMVEFSQANTHKAFHVGHIRGTSIGESISRIIEFQGNDVIRANYQGDTGMHVAKWIWCYLKYHRKNDFLHLKEKESWIASVYVDAVKRLAENPNLQEEVDDINRKLESKKDKKLNELWKKTRQLSLKALEAIYKELNTRFDRHYFESEVEGRGKEISKELVRKGIAKASDGAIIVDLERCRLGIWVLLRKDGTVLYSAKDLALIEKKFYDYNLKRSITIVADEQNLHFQQLFKTLGMMNFKHLSKCSHLSYGLVRLPTGKMSSRTGDNILYSDFKNEVLDYAKQQIKNRYMNIKQKELGKRALAISIAAIKYSMLKQDANKIIIFTKEEAINFEGDTGPYLQYSYARASSILKKAKVNVDRIKHIKAESLEFNEIELAKKLYQFPEIVDSAYRQLNPSLIANYAFQLAQIFNEFYHSCPVIQSIKGLQKQRLALVQAFRIVMKNALHLLGIDAIEEM